MCRSFPAGSIGLELLATLLQKKNYVQNTESTMGLVYCYLRDYIDLSWCNKLIVMLGIKLGVNLEVKLGVKL